MITYVKAELERVSEGQRQRSWGSEQNGGCLGEGEAWGELRAKSSGAEFPINSGFPGVSVEKNPPAVQETQGRYLGGEDPLEKETATHSSILAWEIPDREAWQATVNGLTKSWTQLCD